MRLSILFLLLISGCSKKPDSFEKPNEKKSNDLIIKIGGCDQFGDCSFVTMKGCYGIRKYPVETMPVYCDKGVK